jgi:NADH-quinone oxidoreductase subunit E
MAEDESLEITRKAVKKWKDKRGALIMALHEIQGMYGYIPWKHAKVVAEEMGVALARIYEVLTFYNFFKLESPGKYIVSLCDGTACHIKGSTSVLQAFSDALKIKAGETTPDKLFHLQVVRCLGCCGLAPVVVVNGKTYGRVSVADVPAIIKEWRDKEDNQKDNKEQSSDTQKQEQTEQGAA